VAGQPVTFADTSAGAITSWTWNFGDGTTFSGRTPPPHPFASAGTYTVTLTVRDGSGASSTATHNVGVTAPPDNSGVSLLVPVVLDIGGVGGSHYTTELTLVSRATTPVDVAIRYTASVGSGSGFARITLAPGEMRIVPAAIAYLRAQNLPIPNDGSGQVGTLLLTFEGVTSASTVFAGGRTFTPDPAGGSGTFGLFYPAAPVTTSPLTIFGLQQNDAQRSNLAVVNAGNAAVTLRVDLFGASGESLGSLPEQTLGAYGWYQFNTPLAGKAASGRAVVTRTAGTASFSAYGVLNDAVTSDGSFVPPLLSGDSSGGTRLIPIVLDVQGVTGRFKSEMTLTNFTSSSLALSLVYKASPQLNAAGSGTVPLTLAPNEQRIIADAMGFLRTSGLGIPSDGSNVGGSLLVQTPSGTAAQGFAAGVRTFSPGAAGGSFGLFYPGLTQGESASSAVYLYGLQQNASQRSNVAVVNRGDAGDSITLQVTYYSAAGVALSSPDTRTLAPGEWYQFGQPFSSRGASAGYAKVDRTSGTSRFVAYGILNDQTNGDGSYVPMSP
ncbi:MAG TPA: PKD domain-containing protein, partial [Thermoanaerobaculia bacterium]|nr:PKD domain-containing protein [Thermoanaerobaculia bacterium]